MFNRSVERYHRNSPGEEKDNNMDAQREKTEIKRNRSRKSDTQVPEKEGGGNGRPATRNE